jgi:hypothetical protein
MSQNQSLTRERHEIVLKVEPEAWGQLRAVAKLTWRDPGQ